MMICKATAARSFDLVHEPSSKAEHHQFFCYLLGMRVVSSVQWHALSSDHLFKNYCHKAKLF